MSTTRRRFTRLTLLVVAYVGSIVTANWTSTHLPTVDVGPLIVPAGTMLAGTTFTLRDLLHDTLTTQGVAVAIAVGAGLSLLLATPQIAVASVVAFATSELVDTVVYARLRARSWLRATVGSNIAGLLFDSALFVPLAFGTFAAIPGQVLGKTIATGLTVAVVQIARAHHRVRR